MLTVYAMCGQRIEIASISKRITVAVPYEDVDYDSQGPNYFLLLLSVTNFFFCVLRLEAGYSFARGN